MFIIIKAMQEHIMNIISKKLTLLYIIVSYNYIHLIHLSNIGYIILDAMWDVSIIAKIGNRVKKQTLPNIIIRFR